MIIIGTVIIIIKVHVRHSAALEGIRNKFLLTFSLFTGNDNHLIYRYLTGSPLCCRGKSIDLINIHWPGIPFLTKQIILQSCYCPVSILGLDPLLEPFTTVYLLPHIVLCYLHACGYA